MKRLSYLSVLPILGAFFMAFSVEKVVDYQVVQKPNEKYFKVLKKLDSKVNNEVLVKENKVVSNLIYGKNRVALTMNPAKMSIEVIDAASKYFKNVGFKLEVTRFSFHNSSKQLDSFEVSITEDIENKQKYRSKITDEKSDLPSKFTFDVKKMQRKGLDDIITILADRSTGEHFVASLSPLPPPPVALAPPRPPLAPKAPKTAPTLPVPPKPPLAPKAPLKPPVPPKLGLFNNNSLDSVKLIGEGQLGKNPLVIINGKKYPSNVLYKINIEKVHGTALYKKNNPKPIIKELGENNIDGAVVLETKKEKELFLGGKELEISIDNENKRQDVKKRKPIVSRITLTNKDGEKYDEVTVYRENGSKRASVNVEIGGKVLFLVKGEPKTESELKKLNPNTFGNSVWASEGENHYYKKKFPKIGKNTVATIAFND